MQLYQMLEGITEAKYNHAMDGMELSGIAIDSRKVRPGDLFVCINGTNVDGNAYISQALENGARCIVTEQVSPLACAIQIPDARNAYARISKNFYHKACDSMKIIGVTGTNGKTTTVNLIAEVLRGSGAKVGTVGTMGISYDGNTYETGFTTPDPEMLHRHFLQMQKSGIEYVVMEASAHAIALQKLEGILFEVGVLTNITQDHLDFFETMKNYAAAKLSFFDKKCMKLGLVCSDDPIAKSLVLKANIPILTYGLENLSDIFATHVENSFDHTKFICSCLYENFPVKTNLVGRYNVSNALAAIGVCRCLGLPYDLIRMNLKYINPVEGRFNVIKMEDCHIVIDYAHTPDGLENVLKTARELTDGKLVALFGCGGNRDKLKRPIMGKIASQYADKVILTSDNPRMEKPMDIIQDIEAGVSGDYEICENREEAIGQALARCQKGDTLVIAGKGGEKYQDIGGKKIPYNDFDAVYHYFREHLTTIKGQGQEADS